MKKLNQYNSSRIIKLRKGFTGKTRITREFSKQSMICLLLIIVLFSCDDFFEKDISNQRVSNLIPTEGWSSQDTTVNFSWSGIEGATEYNFQLVSPSFDTAHKLIMDSTTSATNLKLSFQSSKYEWKVRGQNSVYESNYAFSNFEILAPGISPTPVLPKNMDTVRTEIVQFCWSHPDEDQTYSFEVYSDADFQDLLEIKETTDTTVFVEFTDNGQYFWRLFAKDQFENQTEYSSTSTFYLLFDKTIDIRTENVVLRSPVSAGYISTTTVSFWWDEVEGATSYTIQVVSPGFSETTNLIINETLEKSSMDYEFEEGDYQWRVKASNDEYSTDFTTGSFKIYRSDISSELVSLSAPLDGSIIKESEIDFIWEKMEGTEYQFILKKDDWESGAILHQKTIHDTTITQTLSDGTYYWGVKAKDLTNSTETEFSVYSFTLDNTPPNTPVPTSPVNNSEHQTGDMQFQWAQGNDAETDLEYTFKLFEANGYQNELIYSYELALAELSYSFNETGVYYWQVMATDKAGNSSEFSSMSQFTISVANDISGEAVTLNAPYNGMSTTNTEITFWWEELDNAQSYVFQLVKPSFANTEELISETTVTTNKLTYTLEPGDYQWRVKAENSSSQTGYSSIYSLTIQ